MIIKQTKIKERLYLNNTKIAYNYKKKSASQVKEYYYISSCKI